MTTARMPGIAAVLPEVTGGVRQLYAAMYATGVSPRLLELAHLRASQINACSACVHAGVRSAREHGETDDRLHQVAAWRDSDLFDAAERAALELTEAVTRLADRPDPVDDDLWSRAAKHFTEPELAAVLLMIGVTNLFNRLNAPIRHPAGAGWT